MARKKLLHLKSGVVNANNTPKLPNPDQIELGEIAVNYADGYETLAIKNSKGDIIPFTNSITMKEYVDETVSANTKDEVMIVYSGETAPTSGSPIEIFIDESVDPKEADVYTQSEVDAKIDNVVQINESGDTLSATVVVDETTNLEVEFYTKTQVDAMVAYLQQQINELKS